MKRTEKPDRKRIPRRPYRKPAIESARAYTRNALACPKSDPACDPDATPEAFPS